MALTGASRHIRRLPVGVATQRVDVGRPPSRPLVFVHRGRPAISSEVCLRWSTIRHPLVIVELSSASAGKRTRNVRSFAHLAVGPLLALGCGVVRSIASLFALVSLLAHPLGREGDVTLSTVVPGNRVPHPAPTTVSSLIDGTPTAYYAVILKPVAGRELSLPIVQRHAHHLAELDAQGRLVMAGPFVDSPLGLLIMKGSTKAEIRRILNADPMITSGIKTFDIATWVLATRENGFMPPIPSQTR
jgi:uncharacterized protein YciI